MDNIADKREFVERLAALLKLETVEIGDEYDWIYYENARGIGNEEDPFYSSDFWNWLENDPHKLTAEQKQSYFNYIKNCVDVSKRNQDLTHAFIVFSATPKEKCEAFYLAFLK
jgi:hypothetical protein